MRSIDSVRGKQFAAREMVRAAFFMAQPNTSLARLIPPAFDAFSELMAEHAVAINDPGGDWNDLADLAAARQAVAKRIGECADDPNCYLHVIGGDSNIPDYSFEYRGYFLDDPYFEGFASFVLVTLPPSVFRDRQAEFRRMFMRLLTGLPIFAAYASLSLEGDQDLIQKLARRYRGLDISATSSTIKDMGQRAAGAFWLNAYRGELRDAVLAQMQATDRPADVLTATVGGDTELVMLGPEPDRLDRNESNPKPAYRWLAQQLHEVGRLHVPRKVTYFEDEDDMDDEEAQERWHRRFLDGGDAS